MSRAWLDVNRMFILTVYKARRPEHLLWSFFLLFMYTGYVSLSFDCGYKQF